MAKDGWDALVAGRAQPRNTTTGSIPKRTRFLIAHENLSLRKFIKNCLQAMGCSIVTELVPQGNILATLVEEKPHVLVVNGETPEMEGWNLVRSLRALPKVNKTKVVVVSGDSDKETLLGAVKAGVDDYILIPFSSSTLAVKIQALFAEQSR